MVCRSVPFRTCIGCRTRSPRSELTRFVATGDAPAALVADSAGTMPGRGSWLHPTQQCWDLALKKKAFARALRSPGIVVPAQAHIDHGKWLFIMEPKQ